MKFMIALLCGAYVTGAWAADESSSKMTLPEATSEAPEAKRVENSTVTEEKKITDMELRANAGSARRLSLQFFYAYSGPAINDLNDPERPNPNHMSGDYRTFMSGSGNLRLRLDKSTAMNFGTGMAFFEPLQAVTGQDQTRPRESYKNYGFQNPTVTIDRTYKVGQDVQTSTKLTAGQITDAGYKAVGEWGTAGISQNLKWIPNNMRWTYIAKLSWDYYAYARGYYAGDARGRNGDGNASQWYSTLAPGVSYKATDNLNYNTSIGFSYYRNRKDGGIVHPLSSMRAGVEWGISKDIYFNPYLSFFVDSPALNTTSLAFNTTFSIF